VLPELRTLRPRLAALADGCDPLALQRVFATAMLAADPCEAGVSFVDEHFMPYAGNCRSARAATPSAGAPNGAGSTPPCATCPGGRSASPPPRSCSASAAAAPTPACSPPAGPRTWTRSPTGARRWPRPPGCRSHRLQNPSRAGSFGCCSTDRPPPRACPRRRHGPARRSTRLHLAL
jgi:hypothetical protein